MDDALRAVVPQAVTRVEFRTSLTPPSTIATTESILAAMIRGDTAENAPPPTTAAERAEPSYSASQKFFAALKPTFMVESPTFGRRIYAPYGVAGPKDFVRGQRTFIGGLVVMSLGLVGLGYALGYAVGRTMPR